MKEDHFDANYLRLSTVSERDWKVALKKCEDHIEFKLKGRTVYGAHTEANLGQDPYDYYLSVAYEKLMSGAWEWKEKYGLAEQMIRIIDSTISTEIEKIKTKKAQKFSIAYVDPEDAIFVTTEADLELDDEIEYSERIAAIESAIKGDETLEFMWEAIQEGKKPADIAELLEVSPKKLGKLRERFIEKVRKQDKAI